MKKNIILFSAIFIFTLSFIVAYGYTHQNGSKVYFDEDGKFIGVEDEVMKMSRLPNSYEKEVNDYVLMSVENSFGQCLMDKGIVFYGADWCPHCKTQKEILGEELTNLLYFECEDDKQTCIDEGVKAYPTWKIDGELYTGVKTLEQLSYISSCSLI